MAECLTDMHKALNSSPSVGEENEEENKKKKTYSEGFKCGLKRNLSDRPPASPAADHRK